MWDPGPATSDFLLGTWNPGPFACDPGAGTLYVGPYYIETSPFICLDWLLYDGDLRHERLINCMC